MHTSSSLSEKSQKDGPPRSVIPDSTTEYNQGRSSSESEKDKSSKDSGKSNEKGQYFSVRLVSYDYYFSKPSEELDVFHSDFRDHPVPYVPVIRVFGSSKDGRRCLVHVHNVLPYCYVLLDKEKTRQEDLINDVEVVIHKEDAEKRRSAGKPDYRDPIPIIHHAIVVKAWAFYGFHRNHQLFLKIRFYSPYNVSRVADILRKGVILGRNFQIFDAHIPYLLQFLVDFNISGMADVRFSELHIRPPYQSNTFQQSQNDFQNTNFEVGKKERSSKCELEFDSSPTGLVKGYSMETSHQSAEQLEKSRIKFVKSLREIWQTEFERSGGDNSLFKSGLTQEKDGPDTFDFWDTQKLQQYDEVEVSSQFSDLVEKLSSSSEMKLEEDTPWIQQAHTQELAHDSYKQITQRDKDIALSFDIADEHLDDLTQESVANDEEIVAILEGMIDDDVLDEEMDDGVLNCRFEEEIGDEDITGVGTSLDQTDGISDRFRLRKKSQSSQAEGGDQAAQAHQDEPKRAITTRRRKRWKQEEIRSDFRPIALQPRKRRIHRPKPNVIYYEPSTYRRRIERRKKRRIEIEKLSSPLAKSEVNEEELPLKMLVYNRNPPSYSAVDASIAQECEFVGDHKQNVLSILGSNENKSISRLRPFDPTHSRTESAVPRLAEGDNAFQVARLKYLSQCNLFTLSRPPPRYGLVDDAEKRNDGGKQIPYHLSTTMHSELHRPTMHVSTQYSIQSAFQLHSTFSSNHLRVVSVEVLAHSSDDKLPDPSFSPIYAIIASVWICDGVSGEQEEQNDRNIKRFDWKLTYIFILRRRSEVALRFLNSRYITRLFDSERDLLLGFANFVTEEYDFDLIAGYIMERESLGYINDRGLDLGIDMQVELSRMKPMFDDQRMRYRNAEKDQEGEGKKLDREKKRVRGGISQGADARRRHLYDKQHTGRVEVIGRIVMNVWRVMRNEGKFNNYDFEHVFMRVMKHQIPSVPSRTLSRWLDNPQTVHIAVSYVASRAQALLDMLQKMQLVERTCEFARIYGLDFSSTLVRGSQYKVESMLLRVAKPQDYAMLSPSKAEVARQPPPNAVPLVMEPEGAFYTDPVVVVDFASLYPSVIIAYNYCYSTCLGRLPSGGMGVLPQSDMLTRFKSYIARDESLRKKKEGPTVSPNGVIFLPPEIRTGVLPQMVTEILRTRNMIKNVMKKQGEASRLRRLLDIQQLGLKLLACVCFGYTAASFSGRMPCIDIADAIVQTSRFILEDSIGLVNRTKKWRARVVYADTDSMFIHLPRRTVKQAFEVGNDMVDAINRRNPRPIKLKLEKVYMPCSLITKKRYVGFAYESVSQEKPEIDAKGIETIRRDSCPLVAKILEKSIEIFFSSFEIEHVKSYFQSQVMKIMMDKIPIYDFIFSKEVKLGTYRSTTIPPAAVIATKQLLEDRRATREYGERVRYVVVKGDPNSRLVDLARTPEEVIESSEKLFINAEYYIRKQLIPSLERVLGIAGCELQKWYSQLPRISQSLKNAQLTAPVESSKMGSRNTIRDHFASANCVACMENFALHHSVVCRKCYDDIQGTRFLLSSRLSHYERKFQDSSLTCRRCCGEDLEVVESCRVVDCPLYYDRIKSGKRIAFFDYYVKLLK